MLYVEIGEVKFVCLRTLMYFWPQFPDFCADLGETGHRKSQCDVINYYEFRENRHSKSYALRKGLN